MAGLLPVICQNLSTRVARESSELPLTVSDVKKHDIQVAVPAAARRLGPFGSRQTVGQRFWKFKCRLLLEPASSQH